MSRTQSFQLQSLVLGNRMHFTYQRPNPNIEKKKDQHIFKCAEKPHPDLEEAIDDLVEKTIEKMGFKLKNDAWSGFQPKKIKIVGVKVQVDFVIKPSWNPKEKISVTGFMVNKLAEEIDTFVDECHAYVDGRKRKQGDLFARKDAFIDKDVKRTPQEDPA